MATVPRNKFTEHQFTAFVDYYMEFAAYLGQYKRCFDILVEHVAGTTSHVDHVAYPILFLARHSMELGLKTNIRYFSQYSGKDDFTKAGTHDLASLFGAFKMHVNDTIANLRNSYGIEVEKEDKQSFDELCNEVEKLNVIFHQLDKSSDAFRYPVNKKQDPSFEKNQRISILDVNDLLEKSMSLFVYTAAVFAKYTDYAAHINEQYEALMRENYDQNMPY